MGRDWFEALLTEQDVQVNLYGAAREQTDALARGEFDLVMFPAGGDAALVEAAEAGLPVAEFPRTMSEGTTARPLQPLCVFSNAPHPNAAQLFVNWVMTQEGQAAYNEHTGRVDRVALRDDVPQGVIPDDVWEVANDPDLTIIDTNNDEFRAADEESLASSKRRLPTRGSSPAASGTRRATSPMQAVDLLTAAFARVQRAVHQAADGLEPAGLGYRPESGANSIAWLVWHLTRVQDTHVAEVTGREQVWAELWATRTGIERDPRDTGRGDGPDEVGALQPSSAEPLLAYHDEVVGRTLAYLADVDAAGLGRIVDTSYDPPVSVGTRLLSVVNDNLQHAGQARYLRGSIDRLQP